MLDDVDPARASRDCANGKFRNSGQVCISPSRFLVPRSIHDTFVTNFVDTTKALTIGPGIDGSCDLGPLQNERRVDAMEDLVATATREGATLMAGGRRLTLADGWWYEPTVLTGVALTITTSSTSRSSTRQSKTPHSGRSMVGSSRQTRRIQKAPSLYLSPATGC